MPLGKEVKVMQCEYGRVSGNTPQYTQAIYHDSQSVFTSFFFFSPSPVQPRHDLCFPVKKADLHMLVSVQGKRQSGALTPGLLTPKGSGCPQDRSCLWSTLLGNTEVTERISRCRNATRDKGCIGGQVPLGLASVICPPSVVLRFHLCDPRGATATKRGSRAGVLCVHAPTPPEPQHLHPA